MLCTYLSGRDWVNASTLQQVLRLDERRLRAIAEQSGGLIISGPGCPGYKFFSGASDIEDANSAANRLESQSSRMLERAKMLRRRSHQLIT